MAASESSQKQKLPSWLKAQSTYVLETDAAAQAPGGGPRHGKWSHHDPHPTFDQALQQAEEFNRKIWGYGRDDTTVDEFKKGFVGLPLVLVDGGPELGRDVTISLLRVPVRDGTEVEVKTYRRPGWDRETTRHLASEEGRSALVLRIHGGGWTVGDSETEEAENRYLGALQDVVVVSVHYRMAPEFPFPIPLNDCWDVMQWCVANNDILGINPKRIVLVGCSGGGNMAAALALMARDAGFQGIVGQHLSIPVTCHPKFFPLVKSRGPDPPELLSWEQNKDAPLVDAARMEAFWDFYVGSNPEPDQLHSPLLAGDLTGLPPAMVQIAGFDLLRDEAITYAEALKAASVPVEMHIYKGLPHGFYMFMMLDETHLYFKRVIDFVKRCIS